MIDSVILHEVGLRDGLQMEKETVPLETKRAWLQQIFTAGLDIVQLGSFVHPKYVPQMADTDELFRQAATLCPAGTTLSGLVLNERGLERGLACGVELFCLGVSASETHSRKNTQMGVDEALSRVVAMAATLGSAGKRVQVSVQSAFGCGFEGPVPEEQVERLVARYLEAGLTEISLADTAGHADPKRVSRLLSRLSALGGSVEWTCHFHDTYGLGLANCLAALEAGVRCLETSFGGLGGCPFTRVAGGNVATEDLVHLLQRMGLRPEVRLAPLIRTAEAAAAFLGRELPGSIYKTGPIPDRPTPATSAN